MITFSALTDAQYQDARLSLLLLTEGAVNTPYADSVGIPTIGIGFNLQDSTIFGLVMDAIAPTLTSDERATLFGSLQGTFSSAAALNASITATLTSFEDKNVPTSLAFSSTAQMLNVLDTAVQKYETRVDNWLAGIPESSERVVLVSLAYNGLINAGTSPTLRQDILNGNRADAWYQIRYASNGGSSASVGIANRRYVEATQFGLYTNSTNPSQADALQVAQEFADHKSTILTYESTYSPANAAVTKGVAIPDIYAALAPAISTLDTQYHISSSSDLKEVQAVTASTPSLTGDAMNNLLIGSSAGDTLTGGSGNDYIVGGGGNDVIDGGGGTDAAVYSGNPIDYDITHNADGSWTVADVRGSASDGTDTLKNVESVQFSDGTKYALQPNGILDQTDFSFVIDTTGSMTPYIAGVQADADALVNQLFSGGNTDAHIAVVSFKDPQAGDPDVVVLPFTTQPALADRQQAAVSAINSLGAAGGGDIPEGDNSGLLLALNGSAGAWRDSAAVRRIALFTDAPVKDTDLAATVNQYAHDLGVTIESHIVSALAAGVQADTFALSAAADTASFAVQIYTIQVGDDPTATASVEQIATDNGGEFFQAPSPSELTSVLSQIIATPEINGTTSDQTVGDNVTIAPFAGVSIIDPTSDATVTVGVTLSSTANGSFSNLGGGGYDSSTGVYTVAGAVTAVTTALDGLVFVPTDHQVAPGQTVTTGFTINLTDNFGASATDTNTSVVATAEVIPCFTKGTRILVPSGEIAVEDLCAGNKVMTLSGNEKSIEWIGHRHVDCRRHPEPQKVWPIRVRAGAFGAGMPHRDLWLSPDHAVFAKEVLVPIKRLINGTTIAQVPVDEVTYYHVELPQHDLLLAEGLPCESYLDVGDRSNFANGDRIMRLFPDFTLDEKCEAMWETVGCAPLRIEGAELDRVAARLRRRAALLGQACACKTRRRAGQRGVTTTDPMRLFNPNWYLATNPDVADAGADAAVHYVNWGRWEGRLPCNEVDLVRALALVDPSTIIFTMDDVIEAGVDPAAHFCAIGWRERRRPNLYFDTAWYLDTHDVPADMNPLLHYVLLGEVRGLQPSRHFDPAWYRQRYSIGPTNSPLAHYLKHRRTQLFSPLPAFDVTAYVQTHATTMRPDRDPYAHFLAMGRYVHTRTDQAGRFAA